MPSVELARLKQEAAKLSDSFSDPAIYVHDLERMLQDYAVPVHRQGRVKGMQPVLKSYEVPPPLLKQLQLEMTEQAKDAPDTALEVADGLWARRTIETRLLAARLLGAIAADAQRITTRLEAWAHENREPSLAPELARDGTTTLCAQHPDELVAFAGRMLASREPRKQTLALGALQTLMASSDFANLPAVFELLGEIGKYPERKLRHDLADLLAALAARSPKETEYFLEQCLEPGPSEGVVWVIRQVMKVLPEDSRARLQALLKA